MNSLLDLQDKMRTTTSSIGRLEIELSRNPELLAVNANLRSLRKLYASLSNEFAELARDVGIDLCSYTLLENYPSVRTLSRSLGAFQDTFSMFFESLRSGPKQKRIIPQQTVKETELHVAYAFSGSFGVMLTVPRDRLLFQDWPTKADQAIDIVFEVTRSRSSKEVAQVARQLGKAPIAALYDWAKSNAQTKSTADVQWNGSSATSRDMLVQYPEFAELAKSIEETSEEHIERRDVFGILVGADTKTRRFHFVTDNDVDIRGRFTDAISESQKAELPARYLATLEVNTRTNFATAEEDSSYVLLKLSSGS